MKVPDSLSSYNFHSFRSSSLASLQTLDNAQENSSMDVLSLGIWGSAATVKSHQYFPVRFWQEQKRSCASQNEGFTGSWALCLLCFSYTSNVAYWRHSLHWWSPVRVTEEALPLFSRTRFSVKKSALLLVPSRSGCVGGGMEGFWQTSITMAIQGWILPQS